MQLEKALACLSPAPHRVAGMEPPGGKPSPSSAAKHVEIETAGGARYALPHPALAQSVQNTSISEMLLMESIISFRAACMKC